MRRKCSRNNATQRSLVIDMFWWTSGTQPTSYEHITHYDGITTSLHDALLTTVVYGLMESAPHPETTMSPKPRELWIIGPHHTLQIIQINMSPIQVWRSVWCRGFNKCSRIPWKLKYAKNLPGIRLVPPTLEIWFESIAFLCCHRQF